MEQNILDDKIKNWHEVKLESYKIIVDLAKENQFTQSRGHFYASFLCFISYLLCRNS